MSLRFGRLGVAPLPSDLEAVLSGGAAGPGQAYLNYRWKMFTYLIGVFGTIKRLPYRMSATGGLLAGLVPCRAVRGGHPVGVVTAVRDGASAVPRCRSADS